jgi:hypothetical protein
MDISFRQPGDGRDCTAGLAQESTYCRKHLLDVRFGFALWQGYGILWTNLDEDISVPGFLGLPD